MTTTARGERAAASDDIVLRVERLGKTYGGVVALRDVTLEIRRGSIHGLLGENGAGKSTLVGLISGQRVPSSGSIYMNGVAVEKADVPTMEEAGLFLVTQEPMIVDHITAAENLLLGIWPQRRGFVNWRRLRADAAQMLEGTGIDPAAMAGRLDAVSRRKLNILRAMFSGGRVIILDEPTAALTVEDRGRLFDFMRRLKADGVTFIFISHHNDEILDICDAVSVLRDGRLAGGSENVADLTSEALHELVLGRGLELFQRVRRTFPPDAPVIELTDVVARQVDVPTLRLRPGEIVGCTGLPGAGAKELARTMFGLNRARSGTLRFPGADPIALPRSPRDAFRAGIAFLSDDRRREGAVGKMSIGDNIALSSLNEVARVGFVSRDAEARLARRFFEAFGIKAASPDVPVDALSGGNQQKVCLSRVLATKPRLLILDEPTRGIDVGVKQDVLRIIDDLSKTGVPIVIVSTDTDEIMRIADRVLLFRGGSIVDELAGDEINNDRLRRLSHA